MWGKPHRAAPSRAIGAAIAAACLPAGAGDDGRGASERVRPIEAIRAVLGSKRVAGYFVAANGECRLTLMIAEDVDPMTVEPFSAARLVVALRPGQSAGVDSEEGASLRLTCEDTGDEVALR